MGSTAIAAPPRPGLAASLDDIFKFQNETVAAGNYEFLGRCKKIVLEAEEGARTQAPHVTAKIGHVLDWYDTPHPQGGTVRNYLPIGQTRDHKMILALEHVVKRDFQGRLTPEVGLPDMPDPGWKPMQPRNTEEAEALEEARRKGEVGVLMAPMIPQDLNQLTSKIVGGTEFLVFQPVVQILFQPEINGALQATYWTLLCSFDPATRTEPAFLVNRRTGEAHFFGGRFEIVPVG